MPPVSLEEAKTHLDELIAHLQPGEEVAITRGDKPVAKLSGAPAEQPRPLPGRGRGMLTIISDDDDHLKDFAESNK